MTNDGFAIGLLEQEDNKQGAPNPGRESMSRTEFDI